MSLHIICNPVRANRSSQAHFFFFKEHRSVSSPGGTFSQLLSLRGPTLGCKPRETVWSWASLSSGLVKSRCTRPYGAHRVRAGAVAWRCIWVSDSTARASDFPHGTQKMAMSDPRPRGSSLSIGSPHVWHPADPSSGPNLATERRSDFGQGPSGFRFPPLK